ncbi:MAG: LuxR C-terminal-related transcriptional regulator [Anaerolineae bacterium]
MSLQTLRINRPALSPRPVIAPPALGLPTTRELRRSERAFIDGLQALARSGQQVTALIAVDHPGPTFTYDLPDLQIDSPLLPSRYGLISHLLATISKMPQVRAAARAAAHSLSSQLLRSDLPTPPANPLEIVRQAVEAVAEGDPFVLQFNYLHRADSESLQWLQALSATLKQTSLVIVGTFRADQPHTTELGNWLSDADVVRVACAPIWDDDVAIFLDDLFSRKTPLNVMLESAKSHERALLLGGVPLLEMCRRTGRWTDGLTLSERVVTLAQTLKADYVLAAARVIRSQILLGLGQWAEAQAECDLVITSAACAQDRNLAAAALWGGYKARSMAQQPARHLMEALRRWRVPARHTSDPAAAATIMSDMIVHLSETEQLNEARAWQRDLDALAEQSGHPIAKLAASIGQGALAARTADWRMTIGAYRAAVQHAATLHDVLLEARANNGLALALLELGDAESKNEGRERLSLSHSILSRLNAKPDMERCEAGAKQFGLRPRQRRAAASNRTPGSLTRREREVLALVVNGLTNRQIAQRLTISEKTAEGHVGNILAKLSCSSRIKAAELARATGLLENGAI